MIKPPIEIKNTNKFGKVTNKWHVRVGKKWRIFGQNDWEAGGIDWINQQLTQGA